MPSLFDNRDDFNEWLNLDDTENNQKNDQEKMHVISCIHKILRPFMLRRTKADLASKLPDKIEMNVSVGMSELQLKLYRELLTLKGIFQNQKTQGAQQTQIKSFNFVLMQLRKVVNHPYLL